MISHMEKYCKTFFTNCGKGLTCTQTRAAGRKSRAAPAARETLDFRAAARVRTPVPKPPARRGADTRPGGHAAEGPATPESSGKQEQAGAGPPGPRADRSAGGGRRHPGPKPPQRAAGQTRPSHGQRGGATEPTSEPRAKKTPVQRGERRQNAARSTDNAQGAAGLAPPLCGGRGRAMQPPERGAACPPERALRGATRSGKSTTKPRRVPRPEARHRRGGKPPCAAHSFFARKGKRATPRPPLRGAGGPARLRRSVATTTRKAHIRGSAQRSLARSPSVGLKSHRLRYPHAILQVCVAIRGISRSRSH